ncbi:hypothetical protein HMN09_00285300 [Mycena chlorophos]|uniref:Uncharacterized protein n=1 Tax=Mycena chlorophos TaxID=658473 RepID=A0A8H6TMK9_MYCCL|nr:hypothetical protein HMN09_00285300 [Mycena chlorophos]
MFFRSLGPFNLLFLLSVVFARTTSALVFSAVGGPFAEGAQVALSWELNGTEPSDGWELWFNTGGSSEKLEDIPAGDVSTVISFPGVDGAFQGLAGTTVLATSAEVDAIGSTTPAITGTTTFAASITSGSSTTAGSGANTAGTSTASSTNNSSAQQASASSKPSANMTTALLGIIVGTLAVVAIIVVASIMLFVHRRRRAAIANAGNAYPFAPEDVEKALAEAAGQTEPFARRPVIPGGDIDEVRRSRSRSPPPVIYRPPRESSLPRDQQRIVSNISNMSNNAALPIPVPSQYNEDLPLPSLPESGRSPIGNSRRTAYLNAQLERLALSQDHQQHERHAEDDRSMVYQPMSSVPSDIVAVTVGGGGGSGRPRRPTITLQVPALPQRSTSISSGPRRLPLPPLFPNPHPIVPAPAPVPAPVPAAEPSTSRRDAYLSAQLTRLEIAEQRGPAAVADGASVVFSPLSTVPSEPSVAAQSPVSSSGSAAAISTAVNSPILFRRTSAFPESDVMSPTTPRPYVPPW